MMIAVLLSSLSSSHQTWLSCSGGQVATQATAKMAPHMINHEMPKPNCEKAAPTKRPTWITANTARKMSKCQRP